MSLPIRNLPSLRVLRVAVLALCSAAPCAVALSAQDVAPPPPPSEHGHRHGEHMGSERQLMHMKKELNLTDDQVARIRAIDQDAHAQGKALHENTTLAEADRHERMKTLHQDSMAKVRDVLNDDQKQKFDAMVGRMAEHRGHGRMHGDDGPPPPPPAAQ